MLLTEGKGLEIDWADVKAIRIDPAGKKLVFEGDEQMLVCFGPAYWPSSKRVDSFSRLIAFSELQHIPLTLWAAVDLPAYTHRPRSK